jgi:hypothetical protein
MFSWHIWDTNLTDKSKIWDEIEFKSWRYILLTIYFVRIHPLSWSCQSNLYLWKHQQTTRWRLFSDLWYRHYALMYVTILVMMPHVARCRCWFCISEHILHTIALSDSLLSSYSLLQGDSLSSQTAVTTFVFYCWCIILTIDFRSETKFQFLFLFHPKTFVSPIWGIGQKT